jgi:uncharacterized protein (TIGR00645 family)
MEQLMQEPHHNPTDNSDAQDGKDSFIESTIEKIIFGSRWILSLFYLMLVLTLVLVAIKFFKEFAEFAHVFWSIGEAEFVTGVLSMVDKTLLANLLILIIFSGYENFVSVIGIAEKSKDRPKWMGEIDFAGLKLKLIGSIVALSGVHLLSAFLEIEGSDKEDLGWMIGLHITFVVTGVLFAMMEKIGHAAKNNH